MIPKIQHPPKQPSAATQLIKHNFQHTSSYPVTHQVKRSRAWFAVESKTTKHKKADEKSATALQIISQKICPHSDSGGNARLVKETKLLKMSDTVHVARLFLSTGIATSE